MMNVEEEVEKLKEEIRRLGTKQDDGSYKTVSVECLVQFVREGQVGWCIKNFIRMVTFGVLFHDDRCANIFEALVGTLRAAKRRKILTYDGELLLQGVHDNVEIILKPAPPAAAEATA